MTTTQFIYWLQGFMEIQNPKTLNEEQTQLIKDHLASVLCKMTPCRETGYQLIDTTFTGVSSNLLC